MTQDEGVIGTLSEAEISTMLSRQKFVRLGCHADDRTYIVPVAFAQDEASLVCQTPLGLKIDMMRKNPSVCIQFDEVDSLWTWSSVLMQGRYEELTGEAAVRAACLLIDKYGEAFHEVESSDRGSRDIAPPPVGRKVVPLIHFRIHIGEKTGRFEKLD
jgi:nitroimidazol reductase NimA-like FMN-containing flavoprotein (pyridoxamine 5'-phosphate oxidase superfamily)